MRSFTVPDRSPEEFVATVRVAAREHGFAAMIELDVRGDLLEVRLIRLGTSRLLFRLTRDPGGGFAARLEDVRMALTHAPMRERFESGFEGVIRKLGGEVL